jgi:hypothetical protein
VALGKAALRSIKSSLQLLILAIFASTIDALFLSDFPFIKYIDSFGDRNLIEHFWHLPDKCAWGDKGQSFKFHPNVFQSQKSHGAISGLCGGWLKQ